MYLAQQNVGRGVLTGLVQLDLGDAGTGRVDAISPGVAISARILATSARCSARSSARCAFIWLMKRSPRLMVATMIVTIVAALPIIGPHPSDPILIRHLHACSL